MGVMIDGTWHVEEPADALHSSSGEFVRKESVFRNWITTDATAPFPPEADRYHLFLSHS